MWVKIVGNDHLVNYTLLIGYLVAKNLFIITKKSSLMFSQTYRAIFIYPKKLKLWSKI